MFWYEIYLGKPWREPCKSSVCDGKVVGFGKIIVTFWWTRFYGMELKAVAHAFRCASYTAAPTWANSADGRAKMKPLLAAPFPGSLGKYAAKTADASLSPGSAGALSPVAFSDSLVE